MPLRLSDYIRKFISSFSQLCMNPHSSAQNENNNLPWAMSLPLNSRRDSNHTRNPPRRRRKQDLQWSSCKSWHAFADCLSCLGYGSRGGFCPQLKQASIRQPCRRIFEEVHVLPCTSILEDTAAIINFLQGLVQKPVEPRLLQEISMVKREDVNSHKFDQYGREFLVPIWKQMQIQEFTVAGRTL